MTAYTPTRRRRASLCIAVIVTFVVVLIVVAAVPVAAWDCLGHMLVAEVARRHMRAELVRKAEALVAGFAHSGPFAQSPDMVQAACWADDARSWHLDAMAMWHYIDLPYYIHDDNSSSSGNSNDGSSSSRKSNNDDNIDGADDDGVNVMTMTNKLIHTMRAAAATASSSSPPPRFVLQFALVNIVHLVGDAHQPLHAANAFSRAHPDGDRGGNEVHVRVDGERVSLHALWDRLCQRTSSSLPRPLSDDDTTALARVADYLEYYHTPPPALRAFPGMAAIVRESHTFAVNTTYVGVVEHAALPPSYLRTCADTAEARVVLAGYRLADLLNTLLEHLDVDDVAVAHTRHRHHRHDNGKHKDKRHKRR